MSRSDALLRARVLDVVSRWDPESLLAMGCPEDEYEPEARSFAALLGQGVTITPEIVRQVWEEWFGPDSGFVRLASREVRAGFADELNQVALAVRERADT
ncbi:hypothetical protein ACFYOT_27050 [Saccharothrix saharensis]|uniref:hypothetical protein n=1 Tax=Saccharothrix saharensis TaxID=571190 RepID=UPI0036A309BB